MPMLGKYKTIYYAELRFLNFSAHVCLGAVCVRLCTGMDSIQKIEFEHQNSKLNHRSWPSVQRRHTHRPVTGIHTMIILFFILFWFPTTATMAIAVAAVRAATNIHLSTRGMQWGCGHNCVCCHHHFRLLRTAWTECWGDFDVNFN